MAGRHGQGRGTACETETETGPHLASSAEGVRLRVSGNKTGFLGVYRQKNGSKPDTYSANVTVGGGKQVYLGTYATAEEAALCIARSPEGQAAAEKSDKQETAKRKFSIPGRRKHASTPFRNEMREGLRMKVEESGLSEEELAQRQQELFAEARQLLPTRASSVPGSSSDHLASGGKSSARTAWGPPPPQRSTSITEVLDELAAKRQLSGEGRAAAAAEAAEEANAVARAVFTQAQAEGPSLRNSDNAAGGYPTFTLTLTLPKPDPNPDPTPNCHPDPRPRQRVPERRAGSSGRSSRRQECQPRPLRQRRRGRAAGGARGRGGRACVQICGSSGTITEHAAQRARGHQCHRGKHFDGRAKHASHQCGRRRERKRPTQHVPLPPQPEPYTCRRR